MAVTPIPCACGGGGGGTGEACCAPSITSTLLCRPDCTTIIVVVESGCTGCDAPPTQPQVVGWVDPATGAFTVGPAPADAAPCDGCGGCVDTICVTRCDDTTGDGAADTTYSELWCVKQDGTTELVLTYQDDPSTPYTPTSPVDCEYGSVECHTQLLCHASGPFLRRYTFLNGQATFEDVALDGQTPHIVTGTVGVCTQDCVDTICVTRCDDTTGDGAADTTYSELWCVKQDGTTELVLTYQDDPSKPYTPVAPVDCEYGSVQCHTQLLCDDGGPFLRRFTFLSDGTASFVDVALDGETPHIVSGTIRDCAQTSDCDQPREPAATVGLCLADGTPIAVVVTRDCQGVTREEGWINLTTGAYSTGQPPAGVMACGESRSITTTGTFCDVDANGNVVGLVLIEYTYAADGSVSSVRLVDATTGQTYTAQGTITTCPAGVDQPEQDLVVLCDIAADGTVTRFIRDYRRDENGQIVGHTDYTLAGANYQPTGTVDVCEGAPTEPCRNSSTLLLCDLPTDGTPTPTVTDNDPGPYYPYSTGVATAGAQVLWDGGTLTLPQAAGPQPGTTGTVRTAAATIQAPRPVCDAGTAHVSVQVDAAQLGPDDGCASTGFIGLYNGPGDANRIALDLAPKNTPAGWTGTLTVEADVPAADLAAGNITVLLAFDAYDDSGGICPGVRHTSWQLSQFHATVVYDQTGCATQFVRNVITDCETGAVLTVTDTTLDGQPYTVTGEPGQCQAGGGECCPEPPCPARNIVQAEKCDDTDGDGIADAWYVELLGVDCTGTPTPLGTYTCDLSAPYTPVAPVDCDAPDPVVERPAGVQAHRVQLVPGKVWDASQYGTLRAIQATARGGTGTVTTADGTSALFDGETAQWSITRDMDVRLIGPLTITATTGAVVVNWTEGVDL
ncbi:hypothetical protein [Streptomyces prunicolor]|uniref:hypothetical protein n=1 Tax=Streptomyces prunicolor TaxID=67348 RepID=UPI000361E7FF|nr:hypothetical protein [Streptomyces prunicolor]